MAAELVNEVTRLHPELKQLHPYTVILKSGVKVGVDEGTAKGIILIGGESCHRIDGTEYFLNSEIAAIVPTENLMP